MASTTRQIAVPLWRYDCPTCGFGDAETGHMATDHAIYCEVCIEEGVYVKLRRWTDETQPAD